MDWMYGCWRKYEYQAMTLQGIRIALYLTTGMATAFLSFFSHAMGDDRDHGLIY